MSSANGRRRADALGASGDATGAYVSSVGERQSFSRADAAWLHMDRPSNLMVINSILLFAEPLDWDRLTEIVRERLVERYPRFRARVRESLLSGPRWEPDGSFDLGRHMHRRGLPHPGGEAALARLAGDLASSPLDREKPLWEMYLVDGPGVGSAVIVRMHHCIADGIALAEVMLSLTDAAPGGRREEASGEGDDERDERDGERDQENGGVRAHAGVRARAHTRARTPRRNAVQTLALAPLTATRRTVAALTAPPASALAATGRATRALAREGLRTAAHPGHALELADSLAADTRSLAKLLFTPSEQRGALKGELGVARTVAWSKPLDLARIKAIAHAQGATVNDVLLACVSGALRDYLTGRGEQPHGVQTMIPVNLRPLDEPVSPELGNRFGLVFLTLPVDRAGRRERLEELRRRMQAIKRSPEAPVSYAVLEAAGLTPPNVESLIVDVFTAKAAAVMTNVPGPRATVYLAGSPLRSVLVWAPTAGSVGMSVSIFSYAGEVTIGLMVHTHLVPDPQRILNRLPRELSLIGRLSPARGAAN